MKKGQQPAGWTATRRVTKKFIRKRVKKGPTAQNRTRTELSIHCSLRQSRVPAALSTPFHTTLDQGERYLGALVRGLESQQ